MSIQRSVKLSEVPRNPNGCTMGPVMTRPVLLPKPGLLVDVGGASERTLGSRRSVPWQALGGGAGAGTAGTAALQGGRTLGGAACTATSRRRRGLGGHHEQVRLVIIGRQLGTAVRGGASR